ncbi:MAG: helix-turn-helix domain-containing protein [Chitinivibrionales bacterium]|nr:helix-turn-helix domain-containing protein [Chitinivibrionales bacterium]
MPYFIITVMIKATLNNPVCEIGAIIRAYREKTGKYQGAIAERAGISVSMLSQIERGRVSPSIETLMAVCSSLGLDIADLFRRLSPARSARIHHSGERLTTGGDGARYEQLITGFDSAYPSELFLLEISQDRDVELSTGGHDGIEMGYVLSGKAELRVGGMNYPLGAGDSISFNARLPHSLKAGPHASFRAVWCAIPPHTDYLQIEDENNAEL